MLQAFFHAWERRLASVTKDRVVRPFEWGLDWIPDHGHAADAGPADVIDQYVSRVMADTGAVFSPPPQTAVPVTGYARVAPPPRRLGLGQCRAGGLGLGGGGRGGAGRVLLIKTRGKRPHRHSGFERGVEHGVAEDGARAIDRGRG